MKKNSCWPLDTADTKGTMILSHDKWCQPIPNNKVRIGLLTSDNHCGMIRLLVLTFTFGG